MNVFQCCLFCLFFFCCVVDRNQVAIATPDGLLHIIDLETNEGRTFSECNFVERLPNGRIACVKKYEYMIRIFEVASGELIREINL